MEMNVDGVMVPSPIKGYRVLNGQIMEVISTGIPFTELRHEMDWLLTPLATAPIGILETAIDDLGSCRVDEVIDGYRADVWIFIMKKELEFRVAKAAYRAFFD